MRWNIKNMTNLTWCSLFPQCEDDGGRIDDFKWRSSSLHAVMLVNHRPSQQSSKEECKPCKWGDTARYYASHTKTILPTRKSVLKIQQAIGPHEDLLTIVKRRKLQWCEHVSRSLGLAKNILQGTVKGGRRQGRGRGGKTTSGTEQAWSSPSPREQWRTGENGGNWLRSHLLCPNDPGG